MCGRYLVRQVGNCGISGRIIFGFSSISKAYYRRSDSLEMHRKSSSTEKGWRLLFYWEHMSENVKENWSDSANSSWDGYERRGILCFYSFNRHKNEIVEFIVCFNFYQTFVKVDRSHSWFKISYAKESLWKSIRHVISCNFSQDLASFCKWCL